MSADDDFDALLDEALEENAEAEKKAEQNAREAHASRESASKILNATLMNTGGESHLAKNNDAASAASMMLPPGMDNPEQLRLMMTQLTAILTQTQQLESIDPNSPEAIGQEERLLEMAKSLISHAQNNVDDAEEKAKIDSTMKALQRVQEITNQTKSGKGGNVSDDPSVTAELQKISEELQGHVDHSRSQVPGLNAAFEAAAKNNANNDAGANQQQQQPMMTEEQRLHFESVIRQMQAAGVNNQNNNYNSSSQSQLSPEQQAAMFAMLMAMKQEAEQQTANQQNQQTQSDEVMDPAGLSGYYNLIFAKFASIDKQYDAYFAGRGKDELAAGKISAADMARFQQQQTVVKQLLLFKDKQQSIMEKLSQQPQLGQEDSETSAGLGELNSIVEKLRQLGDPPAGFDV